MNTVVDRLLAGEQLGPNAILDAIDAWHEGDSELPLHEYLGFTHDEYARYIQEPAQLEQILAARTMPPVLQALSEPKAT